MSPSFGGRFIRAASEFLVIVVGVLVALALDEWASERRDRLSEADYLEALADDLAADSAMYADRFMPALVRIKSALDHVGPVARQQVPFPPDTLGLLEEVRQSQGAIAQLEARRATFDELLSTGNLRLVETTVLRAAIVTYYEDLRRTWTRLENRSSGYPELVRGYLPFAQGPLTEDHLRITGTVQAAEVFHAPGFLQAMNRHVVLADFQFQEVTRLLELAIGLRRQVLIESRQGANE